MQPDRLRAAGAALFGARWHADLARAIGASRAQVANWAAGREPVPAHRADAIEALIATEAPARIAELQALTRRAA